jgi:hypothetical protein
MLFAGDISAKRGRAAGAVATVKGVRPTKGNYFKADEA